MVKISIHSHFSLKFLASQSIIQVGENYFFITNIYFHMQNVMVKSFNAQLILKKKCVKGHNKMSLEIFYVENW